MVTYPPLPPSVWQTAHSETTETMPTAMRTLKSPWVQLVALGPLFVLAQCCGQGTFATISFDGTPLQPPGTAYTVQQYYESGMSFTPIDPNAPFSGFGRVGPSTSGFADDGTVHLKAAAGDSLKFSFINSSAFNLLSVDLAEYSVGF